MNYVKKMSLMVVGLGILLTGTQLTAHSSSHHGQKCGTYIKNIVKNNCVYQTLYNALTPAVVSAISSLIYDVQINGASAYPALYNYCVTLAGTLPTGRVVVIDPDGLVAVDTGKSAATNTYANYQAGGQPATLTSAINVNHMSRISFIDSQEWPCGLGAETKFSNSVGTPQNYVAMRLDAIPFSNVGSYSYRNSVGSVRMSVNMGAIC